jgi:GAF domain-containing protein
MPEFHLTGRPGDLARNLYEILLSSRGVEAFLAEIAHRGARAVPSVASCAVSIRPTGRSRRFSASSDEFARRLDGIQNEVDDGPCLTAARGNVTVVVDDVANDHRWPLFSRRASAEGAGATLAVPLPVQDTAIGALNLYAAEPRVFDEEDQARMRRFAEQAAVAVALALRMAEREEHCRNLEAALASRTTIDQALGILMGQRRVSAVEAFDLLRRLSQRSNVKLRDVAAALITEVVGEPPPDGLAPHRGPSAGG